MPAVLRTVIVLTLAACAPLRACARWTGAEYVGDVVKSACANPTSAAERALCAEVAALRGALASISRFVADHEEQSAPWALDLVPVEEEASESREPQGDEENSWHGDTNVDTNNVEDEAENAILTENNSGGGGGELCVPGGGGGGPQIEFSGFFSTSGSSGLDNADAAAAFANMQALLQGLSGSELPSVLGDVKVQVLSQGEPAEDFDGDD